VEFNTLLDTIWVLGDFGDDFFQAINKEENTEKSSIISSIINKDNIYTYTINTESQTKANKN